jgi:hypothetical protein
MFLPKNGISETERELQTAVLRGMGYRNIFSKASWGVFIDFLEAFKNSSVAAIWLQNSC